MDDQLKLLMDYTIFHLGVYITLLSVLVGFAEKGVHLSRRSRGIAIFCFLIAGMAGGTIAGNIPLYASWANFERAAFGPYRLEITSFFWWAAVEHTAFWIGVISDVLPVVWHAAFGRRRAG